MNQDSVTSHSVCVVSHDVVGELMAGPGIRYYHIAQALAKFHQVTLAIPDYSTRKLSSDEIQIVTYRDWETLEPHLRRQEVVVIPSDLAHTYPQISQISAAIVIDGYNPLLMEWLSLVSHHPMDVQIGTWPERMQQLTNQCLIGDFFLCASERQRDWWTGMLEAHGRINPYTFQDDPTLRRLVDLVPFGLPGTDPVRTKSVIKGVWPEVKPDDKVVLWGGGLWPWLDPMTAVRAMEKVWQVRQDIKLVFPGTKHPNPKMTAMPTHTEKAKSLAQDLELFDRAVIFGEWIPYEDWVNVLLESDIALSLHFDNQETRLAFRSRIFDYIWAGLPMVVTGGDETSQIIANYGLGTVVDYEDEAHVAQSILSYSTGENLPGLNQYQAAREQFSWDRAVAPLLQFCASPRRAADRLQPTFQPGHPYYLEQVKLLQKQNQEQQQTLDELRHQVDHLSGAYAQLQQEYTQQERQHQEQSQTMAAEQSLLRELIAAYENGLFMKFMRTIHKLRSNLKPG
jgi:glycosyltransferase involved in cell wall biosynthesis